MSLLPEAPVALAGLVGGSIATVNRAFCVLVRHDADALIGQRVGELFAPEDAALLIGAVRSAQWEGQSFSVAGRGGDGVPFTARARLGSGVDGDLLVLDGRGAPIVPLTSAADEYLRVTEWEEADLDKVLSHDVRGALRGTTSFLTLLNRESEESIGERAREFLTTATAAAIRADHMVERIVHYLRLSIKPVRVEPLRLDDLVPDAVAMATTELGEAPVVSGADLPTVWGSRPLVVECLAELIVNAHKFSDGKATVEVAPGPSTTGWSYIRVVDDGPGVAAEFAEDAFSLFRLLQPKGQYPGVGMGLPLARQLVSVQGGRCWIEPADGPGTTVNLRLAAAT